MTDAELMQKIRADWGAPLAAVVQGTQLNEAFLAALIGNESGGDPNAKQFEPGVLGHLWEVLLGRQFRYGSIAAPDLRNYVAGIDAPTRMPPSLPLNAFQRLDELATSWGLTQIMGYHVLEWLSIPAWYRNVSDLHDGQDGEKNLRCAALLLVQFANQFSLDVSRDFAPLFHCWNTGSPTPKTFDPMYVPRGLARMNLYASAVSEEGK